MNNKSIYFVTIIDVTKMAPASSSTEEVIC